MAIRAEACEIVFRSVAKRYPGREATPAIIDLSFTAPAGEICVLIGPSGSGKTTALKMINRLIEPSEGDITIGGESVRGLDKIELRRRIGYVFQQIGLFPHMTVEDNIATLPMLLRWDKRRTRSRVLELLELVGLDAQDARRYPHQFSGGQQQRIGVARAMAGDPAIMLMDEPFGAIDPITRVRLQDDFLRLHREVGKTVIFVTHDIDEAMKMGDRMTILKDGALVQYDMPDAILANPCNEFVADFLGEDRGLKRMSLRSLASIKLDPPVEGDRGMSVPKVRLDTSLRDALSVMVTECNAVLNVTDASGGLAGSITAERLTQTYGGAVSDEQRGPQVGVFVVTGMVTLAQTVIPEFSRGSDCVQQNKAVCWDWFVDNFDREFAPRIVEHIEFTVISVSVGFVIATIATLLAYRRIRLEASLTAIFAAIYTIPALAFFQLMVPITGLSDTSALIVLVTVTLPILFRNMVTGLRDVPRDALEAAEAVGLTRAQTLRRVEIPLALPAIMAALRITTVTIISVATIAAFIGVGGLGEPIFAGIQDGFRTGFVVSAVLAVLLALAADAILAAAQRVLTPWIARNRDL